ncbi:MAG: peptidoglycan-binding protein [Desulfobaccales bacterium]
MKLSKFTGFTEPRPLDHLTAEQLKQLQAALSLLGYPVGDIDGLIGPKTRNAWGEFQADTHLGAPGLVDPDAINALQKKLDARGEEADHDFSTKDGVIQAIAEECQVQAIGLKPQIAYVVATVEWETARTFQPVREAFWKSEAWRRQHLRYYPYYGRGFVQLTWQRNYATYARLLGVDLVNDPDKAMDPAIAKFILVHGFKTGAFTGRKISDYVNDHKTDFVNARRCINGVDHAADIARLAEKYRATL